MALENYKMYLVENCADIKKSNMNGDTCLINSVQSIQFCLYLFKKCADVNAKDIQDETALHYAIQEHRVDTTKLLLEYGANPYFKSSHGNDALRTACLEGADQIFDYFRSSLKDKLFRRLIFRGASYADSLQLQRCIDLWRLLLQVRVQHSTKLHFDTSFGAQL